MTEIGNFENDQLYQLLTQKIQQITCCEKKREEVFQIFYIDFETVMPIMVS